MGGKRTYKIKISSIYSVHLGPTAVMLIVLFLYGEFYNHFLMIIVVAVTLFPAMQTANFVSGTGNLQNSTGKIKVFTWACLPSDFLFQCSIVAVNCSARNRRVTSQF